MGKGVVADLADRDPLPQFRAGKFRDRFRGREQDRRILFHYKIGIPTRYTTYLNLYRVRGYSPDGLRLVLIVADHVFDRIVFKQSAVSFNDSSIGRHHDRVQVILSLQRITVYLLNTIR